MNNNEYDLEEVTKQRNILKYNILGNFVDISVKIVSLGKYTAIIMYVYKNKMAKVIAEHKIRRYFKKSQIYISS